MPKNGIAHNHYRIICAQLQGNIQLKLGTRTSLIWEVLRIPLLLMTMQKRAKKPKTNNTCLD